MSTRPALLVAVLLAAPAAAGATEGFPRVVESELGMTFGPPPCSVCHLADVLARDSVDTPFGQALRTRGLVPYDNQTLRRALDAMRSERVDSDGDGTSDTDELLDGTDPNLPEGLDPMPNVSYGCAAAGGHAGPGDAATLAAFALVAAARRRRRS
jgi:MYXO-CTERM domain-containing protein